MKNFNNWTNLDLNQDNLPKVEVAIVVVKVYENQLDRMF